TQGRCARLDEGREPYSPRDSNGNVSWSDVRRNTGSSACHDRCSSWVHAHISPLSETRNMASVDGLRRTVLQGDGGLFAGGTVWPHQSNPPSGVVGDKQCGRGILPPQNQGLSSPRSHCAWLARRT